METKQCGTCKETKPIEQFARKRGAWSSKCKACHNEYYRNYWQNTEAYEKHKARVNERRPHRAIKYGITEQEYIVLLNKHDGMCHVCKTRPATDIDHCHITNEVRGILCNGCNTSIGKLGDTIEGLQRAIDYLAGRRE